MTERKSSYLTGLSLANQYAVQNAFKGNAGADFGAMLLFRNAAPFDGFDGSTVLQFLCGNLQAPAANNTKGWALLWQAGSEPDAQLQLVYGDSGLAQQTVIASPVVPTAIAQRSMLVHMFLLRDPSIPSADNVTALLYVNGALVARSTGLSQTPADGTGTFRIGGGSLNGSAVDAPGIGICGFSYCNSIPGATLAAKLATVQAMVDATVAQSLTTGDMADDALVTNAFSVRKGLPDPKPTWASSKGSINLARVGTTSLSVEAADPLFGDVPWAVIPVPNPLEIMGQAGLLGWWNAGATTIGVGGAVSAVDLSGNGKDLGQPVSTERLAYSPAGSVRGLPCWVADGSLQALFNNTFAPPIGDFVSVFAIVKLDPAAAAFANAVMLSDGLSTTVAYEITALAGLVLFTNGIGGGGFKIWLTGLFGAHSASLVLSANPTVGRIGTTIETPTVPPATSGGIPAGITRVTLGADTIVNVGGGTIPWTGELYEAWLTTTTPTPLQLAQMFDYIAAKYGAI